ncbi:hypothetical protein [Streptomyces xiamenensis]|uniref:hypothetical protein n=1 Tax=Streptomyces xiamenensis TaxID=408015 RepID=UPI0037D427A0
MTTVTIHLREGGAPDTVNLDDLTPRARALAEALAQGSLDIWVESEAPLRDRVPDWEQWYTPERAEQPERRPWRGWARYPADSTVTPVEHLEYEATKIPPDWRVIGSSPFQPVPSFAAAAADAHLDRRDVPRYLSSRGAPMDPAGWDTLRGTGHLPEPDRYVAGRPQWRPASLDAYAARPVELWRVSRVAEYLGYGGTAAIAAGSARRQLSRWGLLPVDREPGRGGQGRYAADQVQAAHAGRPRPGRAVAPRS